MSFINTHHKFRELKEYKTVNDRIIQIPNLKKPTFFWSVTCKVLIAYVPSPVEMEI